MSFLSAVGFLMIAVIIYLLLKAKSSPIEYCGRFLPVVRFFLPLFAGRFTNVCGIVYQ